MESMDLNAGLVARHTTTYQAITSIFHCYTVKCFFSPHQNSVLSVVPSKLLEWKFSPKSWTFEHNSMAY